MRHFFAPGRGEKALLQENYRSTGNILKVGAEVIRENTERVAKTLRPTKEQGDPVQVVQAGTEEDEAAWIADKIAGRKSKPSPIVGFFSCGFERE
jgi:superfamily I DNA/RNA helicase